MLNSHAYKNAQNAVERAKAKAAAFDAAVALDQANAAPNAEPLERDLTASASKPVNCEQVVFLFLST